MSETNVTVTETIDSPPPSAMPAREAVSISDPRQTLHRLASELMRAHNRKLLVEFLQLRRVIR